MKQNQQLKKQSKIEAQLANYMSVIEGLKETKTEENLRTPTGIELSPEKQRLSEITMNSRPVIMNSEE